MTAFVVVAAALVILSLAVLILALRSPRTATNSSRAAANRDIYRSQLAELEREHADGSLRTADYQSAQTELQRRLLVEALPEEGDATPPPATSPRLTAFALLVAIPLVAVSGYLALGTPRALDPQALVQRPQVTPAQIEAMVTRLAERLKEHPEDIQGWMMLARSYKNLGRLPEAANAYSKIEADVAKNPDLLTDYAEILASIAKSFKGKPAKLVEQALKLDSNHPRGLLLAGVAALEKKEYKTTIAYWEKLLPMVEPGSQNEAMIQGGLAKLREQAKNAKP